jgi:5'-3' exonuclease
LLKATISEVNLKKFRGQTCVVDIMSWLYRGAFSTVYTLQDGTSKQNSLAFMAYPLKMLKLLIAFEIRPICIFDGRPHAGKIETEKKRAVDKAKNR